MNSPRLVTNLAACATLMVASTVAFADVVETKNGSRLVGKVVKIDGTVVVLSTEYAGEIKVKQSDVVSLSTESPLNIRLSSGTVLQGTVSSTGDGAIAISGADGTLTTRVEKVASTWAPGGTDPAVAALQRSWAYEVAADVTGKTGNKEQLGTQFSARATLKTAQDTLQFYSAYNRQVTDGDKSADQFNAGVDYQNNFSGRKSWYVRDEGGFDRVKDIELYNIAAAGLGYDFIKEPQHVLTGRAGLSFRYEGYGNPVTEDVKSAGLDFGINHRYETGFWSVINRISYVPLFEDFGNYRILHESYLELPLADPAWKLRLGLANDYNSQPSPGVEKLDTTYFARLVLNWK
jgi:putative salt-induced outer membrane protein YdiY/small nuclear ribonucleoprotein (snRNP)-like protein